MTERKREIERKYRERNREKILARRRELYALNPERDREKVRAYREKNKEQIYAYNAIYSVKARKRLRSEFIAEYGSKCACCGETEPKFLQLDHIKNDGAADRRRFRTGHKILAELKRHGWPKDRYRLLCANCNFGRAMNGGLCPHEDADA